MAEMLPEYYGLVTSPRMKTKNGHMMDLFAWIQCFASNVGVLAGHLADCVPELMAYMYMDTITPCVSQDSLGLAWVRYNASFHCQVATTGNCKWSQLTQHSIHYCLLVMRLW